MIEWSPEGQPFRRGDSEPVVRVKDPRGWTWEVTTDGDRITSLTVLGEVTQEALRVIPLGYLRDVATGYLRQLDTANAQGLALTDALGMADHEPEVRVSGEAPSAGEFAEAWLNTPATEVREGKRRTRRQALAERYGVTPFAVDKWTRAARDAGLIPAATTGRGNKTSGGEGRRANREKEGK
ncbi:hypothetical protein [Nocardioides sp. TF02-7]|uniref:hypothetical protein n=1 Tax=Nocardioides sp. TF02-7 TaxID=2917724 RepID=UPI001F05865B|nr:hypothetical protein [Nocardioides sp. TF02-7]UMG94151.1 hypothetical protein MF408_09005 [Nocardioides sp. TF02-7]